MKKFLFTIAILMFFVIASDSVHAEDDYYFSEGKLVCINDDGIIVNTTNGDRICPTGKPCEEYKKKDTRKCEKKESTDDSYYRPFYAR